MSQHFQSPSPELQKSSQIIFVKSSQFKPGQEWCVAGVFLV
jgi:hypothetical protein